MRYVRRLEDRLDRLDCRRSQTAEHAQDAMAAPMTAGEAHAAS